MNQSDGKIQDAKRHTREAVKLRSKIVRSLRTQGFRFRKGILVPPEIEDKNKVRNLHREAVRLNVARSRAGLERHEDRLLSFIASGVDIVPEKIRPRLVIVQPGSEEELLFRYARLHWSIPVSAGYGRRLRFVVIDEFNNKLIGIFGLGDPIYALNPRDQWIGWDLNTRKKKLQSVMDLFVLGAVPPYSHLLCGKLVALLATSHDVQDAFHSKYVGHRSYISNSCQDGRLALLTTTSALGRSSLYSRLKYRQDIVLHSVGFTSGSGDFHFCNGFYRELRDFALMNCNATAKHTRWGRGFRNRRELVQKTLRQLGMSNNLRYHGIKREVFVAPLAVNAAAYLRGEQQQLRNYNRTVEDLFEWFRIRWLLPRAMRDDRYLTFDSEKYRLWNHK